MKIPFIFFLQTCLDPSSVDVAIFCLSLMGLNYPNYLKEAHRVLKPRFRTLFVGSFRLIMLINSVRIIELIKIFCSGWLLIAEVKSRLDPKTGGADPNKFIKAVCELGFTPVSKVQISSFHLH